MAVGLIKGQKIDLTKMRSNCFQLLMCLGWQTQGGIDVDASAFLLNVNGKAATDDDFIFYGNPVHASKSVELVKGITGADKAQLRIAFDKVPPDVERIAFTATIYDDGSHQTFEKVCGIYLRIVDEGNGEELARYTIDQQLTSETAIVVGGMLSLSGTLEI